MVFENHQLEEAFSSYSIFTAKLNDENAYILNGKLFPRGIVALNKKTNKVFCVDAKVRNYETKNVIKSILKLFYAAEKLGFQTKKTLEDRGVENARLNNLFRPFLSSHIIFVLDKNKEIIEKSIVKVYSGETLSAKFKCNKNSQIYQSYVLKDDNDFSTPEVAKGLEMQVEEISVLWDLKKEFNKIICKIADETEKGECGELAKAQKDEEGKRMFFDNSMKALEKASEKNKKASEDLENAKKSFEEAKSNYMKAAAETNLAEEESEKYLKIAAAAKAEEKDTANKVAAAKAAAAKAAVKNEVNLKKDCEKKGKVFKDADTKVAGTKKDYLEKAAAVKKAKEELKHAEEYTEKCRMLYA